VVGLAVDEPSEFCPRPSATDPKAAADRPVEGASTSFSLELAALSENACEA